MVYYCTEKRKVVENLVIIGGLIAVQFVYAGNSLLLSYLMSLGLNSLSFIIFSTFATFIVLSPICVLFERNQWPDKLTMNLFIQLVLISFSGVTLFQSLFLKGIKLTSPAMATAMPNLAPGLIFVIAWAFRLEQVDLRCVYSRVKIGGTLICVMGAFTMSFMQGTKQGGSTIDSFALLGDSKPADQDLFDKEKIIGCLYLMASVVVLSTNVVLQAHTLGDFPAPMTLCAATSLIGVAITILIQLAQDKRLNTSWPMITFGDLMGYSFLAGSISGACVSFNGWAMKKRGPVLVAMFNPISTVISAVISAITFDDTPSLGSLTGMCLMFTGLYFVLWAKGKEGFVIPANDICEGEHEHGHGHEHGGDDDNEDGADKPLLA